MHVIKMQQFSLLRFFSVFVQISYSFQSKLHHLFIHDIPLLFLLNRVITFYVHSMYILCLHTAISINLLISHSCKDIINMVSCQLQDNQIWNIFNGIFNSIFIDIFNSILNSVSSLHKNA